MHTILTLAVALALGPVTARAAQQPAPTPDPAPDSSRVFLVTLGPGAAVWERFGHNALWIHDPETGTDRAYHYGLFDMAEEGFLLNFLRGRMFYSMGSAHAPSLIEAYRRYGRDATIQELRLTYDETRKLRSFLEWNLRPENRVYRYDYFRDNCSTRIRDALDDALDGVLRDALEPVPAEWTYRSQAVALTAEDAILTTGMDLGLGPLADRPISRWELAFIPMRLRDAIRELSVRRDGRTAPLVVSERFLPPLGRPDEQLGVPPAVTAPRLRAVGHLFIGLLVGGLMAGLGVLAKRPAGRLRAAARLGFAVTGAGWGLVAGLLGLVLLGLWLGTDHEFAWRNENLLQANPLALALVVLVPVAVKRSGSTRATQAAGLLAALSITGLALHFLPVTPQANLPIIALALPIHAGTFWALRTLETGAAAAP